MGAAHSADADAVVSDPPASERRKNNHRRRRHSVDSVASYSSQNHVDRIRTQNFSAASCHDDVEFGSIKTSLFRRSSSNLEIAHRRPESVTSTTTSSTRSRLRELVERKTNQEETVVNVAGDIQYFGNPTETLEFDKPRSEGKKSEERPKKRKLSKSKDKDKDLCENKSKKHEKYQSKLAEYYKLPVQLPQDEFYQHLTRSKAAEELGKKRFTNLDSEFSGSYGRLCKHKEPEGSNLRRSRSLAVIREETFTDLQIQNNAKNKRSQLIPRARLFDKPCFKDRLPGRAKYQTKEEVLESIYIDSTASCFGDINAQKEGDKQIENVENKSDKDDAVSRHESNHSRSISGSWPNLADDLKTNNLSEDSRNPSEIDSLDSNYVRKHYNFDAHLKNNYKRISPDSERSIACVSPNNNNKLYITTDDQETESEIRDRSKNTTPKSFAHDSLSSNHKSKDDQVPAEPDVDDKELYDEVDLAIKTPEITDIGETVSKQKACTEGDARSIVSEHDGTVSSPGSITSYISISIASSTDKSHKLEYLANSLAKKIDEYCEARYPENISVTSRTAHSEKNQEIDPIYTRVNKKRTFADIKKDSYICNSSNSFNEIPKKANSEIYISNTYIEGENYSSKDANRLCTSSKNITTEPFVTTLIENQYYSLPDINISKCLRKSERIDAQLREEDPEDIPSENTYEIAHSNFREILSAKSGNTYGQLNQIHVNNNPSPPCLKPSSIYFPEYSDTHLIENFSKLEDDLKSIITVESSNGDDKDYYRSDTHQNEREINEIESTIRNTKLITKSESLKINSVYRPQVNLSKSYSNDNLTLSKPEKKRSGIKKHYSLRQRDPEEDVICRMPSPSTIIKGFGESQIQKSINNLDENKRIASRAQSFKTPADSNLAIIPLSGHQTLVVEPPLHQPRVVNITNRIDKLNDQVVEIKPKKEIEQKKLISNRQVPVSKKPIIKSSSVDTSSYYTPKDPFITIKLNKVIKTTVPKLKKEASDKISAVQYKFEKPPTKLIIKDKNNKSLSVQQKIQQNMTRPQILQVVDSKNRKTSTDKLESIGKDDSVNSSQIEIHQKKQEIGEIRNENTVKDKINNAIKTDIEYQEKLHSVKNYWSKLIEKPSEGIDITKQDSKTTKEENQDGNEKIQISIESANQIETNDEKRSPEISVGTIIKSIESVKIVDSIKKLSQTKLQLWKDETEKVKSDTEIEESTVKKIVKDCEGNIDSQKENLDNKLIRKGLEWTRDTPEIEIVELSSDDNQNQKTQATLIKAKGFDENRDEFDHVRYKVMKSDLFKNSMIANYKKEAQFDGLLQYLQDYSFQELLVNNNIVIIEPVRTKVDPPKKNTSTETCKIAPSLLKKTDGSVNSNEKSKNVRRHFFYHPIRVNKEIIEEELPNPDTVKKVRNLFEDTLKMKSPMTHDPPLIDELNLTRRATSYRNLSEDIKGTKVAVRKKVIRPLSIDTNYGAKKWDNASLSSGVSSGDLSSNNEYENEGLSPYNQKNLKENVYSSSDEYLCDSMNHEFCCESQYVSPDILKKIRDCGTSVTYYGGKVLNSKTGSIVSPMTKAIMDEIKGLQKNCSRDCYSCQTKCRGDKCNCLIADKHTQLRSDNKQQNSSTSSDSGNQDHEKRHEGFPGFKFKLVKSNSCSSRLELTGTDDIKNLRNKLRGVPNRTEDPPLVYDDENSVKNKICRLESYSKGIVKTPFENMEKDEEQSPPKNVVEAPKLESDKKIMEVKPQRNLLLKKEEVKPQNESSVERNATPIAEKPNADSHSFEKKFYYVNDKLEKTKASTGKFGEMVFEEFEVLENCYDSLNSNKSMK